MKTRKTVDSGGITTECVCYPLLLGNFVSTTKILDWPKNIAVLHQSYILACLFFDPYQRLGTGLGFFSKEKPLQKASKT